MSRHATLSQSRFPLDGDSLTQAEEWAKTSAFQILDWTWRAYDALHANILSGADLTRPLEQLERDLAQLHFGEIQSLWARETGGECAYSPRHEQPEFETRSPAPAKPPAYDIAFVWNDNPRIAWPIEAKVVPTPGTLAAYLGDTQKFCSGTAAPFTGEGAQIAYLLTGTPREFFDNLRSSPLTSSLQHFQDFPKGSHGVSSHVRNSAPDLRLHHLAMSCWPDRTLLPLADFDS